MDLRTWSFTNFAGLRTPPSILSYELSVEAHWADNLNQIVIEGIFPTRDDSYQIILENIILKENTVVAKVGVNRLSHDIVMDIGRFVPYQIEIELESYHPEETDFPENVKIIHEDDDGGELYSKTITRNG